MKKVLICTTAIVCLLAVFAFSADKTGVSPTKGVFPKTATMNARGRVVEISEKAVRIERSIKGKTEIMEFALESPAADIVVNDSIKIDYTVKDGKLTASRIAGLKEKRTYRKDGSRPTKEKPAPHKSNARRCL
ncbi:MAG: hypothetical protein PHF23_00690 [Smithellaceae bacterium]|nr:hypothetical protein [Smithellaceae bacterium]